MQPSSFSSRWSPGARIGLALTALVMIAAGAVLAAYAFAAWDWRGNAFAGFLPTRDLTVSDAEPFGGVWPALAAGLAPGDRILGVGGVALDGLPAPERVDAFNREMAAREPGQRVILRFAPQQETGPAGAACQNAGENARCSVTITLGRMSLGDFAGFFGVNWLAGAALWLIALALVTRWPDRHTLRILAALTALLAVVVAGRFDSLTTQLYIPAWLAAQALAGGLAVMLGLAFPYALPALARLPALGWSPLIGAAALGGAAIVLDGAADAATRDLAMPLASAILLAGALALAGLMFWRRARAVSPSARNQATMLLLGAAPGLAPGLALAGWWIVTGHLASELVPFLSALVILFPLSAAYAALQFRLVDTDRVITQSILYGLMVAMLTVAYWLVVAGVALWIGRSARETALSPVAVVTAIFVVAVAFLPLRGLIQRAIDAAYFRTRRGYQTSLERFSREVPQAATPGDVLALVQRTLAETVAPAHAILFTLDADSQQYRALPDPATGVRPTDLTFTPQSGLVRYLAEQASVLTLEDPRPLPLEVVSDRARLAVLGAPVLVGLRGQRKLDGFLAIGPRQSGAAYLHEDLRFFESLSDPLALAVERAQAVGDLERRVRVQDVLSQVSRALNFAIDFDTLLELLYAQTRRVIPAPYFTIALRDAHTDELTYVFYNDGDERNTAREGARWRMGLDLVSEIARTQQTLRTDDYVRESLLRDPRGPVENPNLKAWMGVPLLADTGGGVLGVMVAATTEPGVTFTDEQQGLFWDIANLAASAIDKLQLLNKTQQRARQLSAINEIATRLASELGNVDRLLQLITENAVQILGAQAGSLLLVDEETGDLEFRVVAGGGASLIGRRIPAGSGLAGATVQRGAPIIVNDPSRDSRWYGDVYAGEPGAGDNGFESNAILSVPLLAQGRAIGVLQTINKLDGSIFVPEDADLLATFAGQAAIAIENARLFDMTDQQLALRVQELDTMQRIDQELNRTLNLNNVVDITMDWALRKSGASAGALLILDRERNELQLVASYGYEPDSPLGQPTGATYPADRGVIGRGIRSGQPSLVTDVSIDPAYEETLPGCVAQLTVPLFSANQVIGVILLESADEGALDLLDLDFVARLAEHASPAIVNARLFQELTRANEARSEFVSIVAHELKNPMTSMRGYTDLLLKGVVGPVNEQQAGFLNTIFNNVMRMETLVSDLNDLTKQQTNNLRLEIAPVDLREALAETLRAQQRLIEDKEQTLTLDVPDDLPPVAGDFNRLIQIMTNFVSNANKYTGEGGTITISAQVARNVWDPQGAPQVVHCAISDTGIGMSEDDLAQLFVPYFRSEDPRTRDQPGTGLGLAITRGLVEQHGGRVWVESALDEGTTFHFTLPLATEPQRARA